MFLTIFKCYFVTCKFEFKVFELILSNKSELEVLKEGSLRSSNFTKRGYELEALYLTFLLRIS